MFFLRYPIMPTASHPEYSVLGEGLVCCWIEAPDLEAADALARRAITDEKWEVLERETAETVTEADYAEDDDWRPYYEQALTDKTVYLYHLSPRYPVYWVTATVEQGSPVERAEAHYLLSGDSIVGEDEEVAVPDFWTGERRQVALDAMREAIVEAGWTIIDVVAERPCGPDDLPEDLVEYYDEAEEEGACLVFVGEGPDDSTDTGEGTEDGQRPPSEK